MNLRLTTLISATALLAALAGQAHAADVAAPPAPKPSNTISLEFSPEWKTTDGSLADDYLKFGYSHSFENNVVWGAAFQYSWRPDPNSYDNLETSLGYKYKSGDFTLTPTALIGYGFGEAPKINPAKGHGADAEAYYALSLAGDWKLDDHWTWNVFNVRYRNAFSVTWITPKVSTGITYKFDGNNAVYGTVGYGWKDKGDGNGLQADKWNVAVGYKLSF